MYQITAVTTTNGTNMQKWADFNALKLFILWCFQLIWFSCQLFIKSVSGWKSSEKFLQNINLLSLDNNKNNKMASVSYQIANLLEKVSCQLVSWAVGFVYDLLRSSFV